MVYSVTARRFLVLSILAVSATGLWHVHAGPVKKGVYLGQPSPGMTPELFAPGLISTGHQERALTLSPQGTEIFFQRRGRGFTTLILTMKQTDQTWGDLEVASFSGFPVVNQRN
jgi:hypothetical protein